LHHLANPSFRRHCRIKSGGKEKQDGKTIVQGKFLFLAVASMLLAGCLGGGSRALPHYGDTEYVVIDNVRLYRDHRGVFYYMDENGPTKEPYKLPLRTCQSQFGSCGRMAGVIGMLTCPGEAERAQTELQCEERRRWEQRRGRY
jgi:hypothetical protein